MVSRVLYGRDFLCNSSRRVIQHFVVGLAVCLLFMKLAVIVIVAVSEKIFWTVTLHLLVYLKLHDSVFSNPTETPKNLDPIEAVHHSTATSVYRQ